MAAKAEIGWKRLGEDGVTREVRARRVGGEWRFAERLKRFDTWKALPEPSLEHWRTLLEAIERRTRRRLADPKEIDRIQRRIREQFPEADA